MRSDNRTMIIASFSALAVAALTVVIVLAVPSRGRNFSRAYAELQLGMSTDQTLDLLGTEPEFVCYYQSSLIMYFRSPPNPFLDFSGSIDTNRYAYGMRVGALADIPSPYDYVTLAFDTNDNLHAYTWIGETYTVETTKGSFKGSEFSELEPLQF